MTDEKVQELLKPRYKVIADWPGSLFAVGEIIYHNAVEYYKRNQDDPVKWPHLFKKLEWWEERKPEEMPEYVRDADGKVYLSKWKPNKEWEGNRMLLFEAPNELQVASYYVHKDTMCFYEPATESEYKKQNP